jgi:hypothetical protein
MVWARAVTPRAARPSWFDPNLTHQFHVVVLILSGVLIGVSQDILSVSTIKIRLKFVMPTE